MGFIRMLMHSFTPKDKILESPGAIGDDPMWTTIIDGPIEGLKLLVNKKWQNMIDGTYDIFIFESLQANNIDLNGMTIWDVGAHVGYHSLAFSKLAGPRGKVIAFEPNPYNIERLRLNLSANSPDISNVQVFENALSDLDEIHDFKINSNIENTKSSGSFLDYGSLPSDRYSPKVFDDFQTINIQVYRPDTIVFKLGVPEPNLIKLDIEGAEVRFLSGAVQLIEKFSPAFVIEVHNIQNMFSISEFFYTRNYTLRLLDSNETSSSRCFVLAMKKL